MGSKQSRSLLRKCFLTKREGRRSGALHLWHGRRGRRRNVAALKTSQSVFTIILAHICRLAGIEKLSRHWDHERMITNSHSETNVS